MDEKLEETLKGQIGNVLDKHSGYGEMGGTPWCGCFEGDTDDWYPEARREAILDLIDVFKTALIFI